ncbi:MAG: Flp pilus assembly protein CpaB [Planctomycetota bacterium]|jgi:Flp pilus assembly protein CpaB
MKWTIILLVILGLVAAFSASILVTFLRAGDSDTSGGIVIATSALPRNMVITSDHIKNAQIPKEDLPEGYLVDPSQAIGRVLAVPIAEGQVLTNTSFVTRGSEADLAAILEDGMRAVSIPMSREAVRGLYPGCIVDVLASFRLSGASKGEAISTTLLHGIQVLAVEQKTMLSKKEDELTEAAKRTSGRYMTVTLMVDSRQAEALQLALRYGTVSLALRNPFDKRAVDFDATVLSQGRLAKLGSLLGSTVVASESGDLADRLAGLLDMSDPNDPNYQPPQQPAPDVYSQGQGQQQAINRFFSDGSQPSSHWQVTVIRGTEVEEEELIPSGDVE